MRYIRYLFLAVVGVVLIIVALANRNGVALHLVPNDLAVFLPFRNEITLPLFLVILGSVLVGLLLGFVWEYFREYKHRATANRSKHEVNRLEREVKGLRVKTGEHKDDVLALLE